MSFTAQDQSVYDLFNRNCYHIPRNQRRYVWSKRNWQDLFDDVMLVNSGIENTHFIGSVVLFREKDRENGISYYTIIDGQQRIMTLSIMLASIAFWLKCYSAENEFNGIKQYLFAHDDSDKDHVIIASENYMSFEQIVHSIVSSPLEMLKTFSVETFLNQNTVNKKDKNIVAAFRFFLGQINDAVKKSRKKPVNFLVGLRDSILNKILYVSIIATSEEDACTIFEILNARGAVLEDYELLKNFIMRGLKPEGDIDRAKLVWNEIEKDLGHNFGHFVKHYATHRYRNRTQNGISDYQIIRLANKGLPTQELLVDICKKAAYYTKLTNPHIGDEPNCTETEYMVYSFFKKRRHEQIRPVLLSLIHQKERKNLSDNMYEETILFLYDFFICYNIIGQENSNKITNIIYEMAYELENNFSDTVLQHFIAKLNSKLPNKENFVNAFSLVGWSHHGGFYDDDKDKERVQIILEVLERYKNASGHCDEFTIEHILEDSAGMQNGKIGNLIPLEGKLNKQCREKSFNEKLGIYKQSAFQTARNIPARYKTIETFDIDERTVFMANEIYNHVLKFNIHIDSEKTKKFKSEKKQAESNPLLKTIEEIVDMKKTKRESRVYNQMTLFDMYENIN